MESLRIIRTFSAPSYAEVLQREVEAKKALALRCQAAIQALNEKLLEKKLRECGESAGKTYFGMFRVVPAKEKKTQPSAVSASNKAMPEKDTTARKVCQMFDCGEFYAIAENGQTIAPYYTTKAAFFRNAHKRGYSHVEIGGKVGIIPAKYRG